MKIFAKTDPLFLICPGTRLAYFGTAGNVGIRINLNEIGKILREPVKGSVCDPPIPMKQLLFYVWFPLSISLDFIPTLHGNEKFNLF